MKNEFVRLFLQLIWFFSPLHKYLRKLESVWVSVCAHTISIFAWNDQIRLQVLFLSLSANGQC